MVFSNWYENELDMKELKIGVVGYSAKKFDKKQAKKLLALAFDMIDERYPSAKKIIVSGLTDVGIPALAYRESVGRKWKTVGIACSKAKDFDCFKVDKEIIVGDNWGDESPTFLKKINLLVRVGGGEQAFRETNKFMASGKPVLEFDV